MKRKSKTRIILGYKIIRFLGEGANGRAYLAEKNRKRFVIKFTEDDGEYRASATILKKKHQKYFKNIVRFFYAKKLDEKTKEKFKKTIKKLFQDDYLIIREYLPFRPRIGQLDVTFSEEHPIIENLRLFLKEETADQILSNSDLQRCNVGWRNRKDIGNLYKLVHTDIRW
jgi:hypothetical protein